MVREGGIDVGDSSQFEGWDSNSIGNCSRFERGVVADFSGGSNLHDPGPP